MDYHNPIIERNLMLDRLENYRAPRMSGCMVGLLLCAAAILTALIVYFDSAPAESKQAVAPERTLPLLAHPLGCPEEDAKGRRLQATLSIQGERKPRCYYNDLKGAK